MYMHKTIFLKLYQLSKINYICQRILLIKKVERDFPHLYIYLTKIFLDVNLISFLFDPV